MKRRASLILIAISCFLFGSASIIPIFSVEPAAGEWTSIVELLSPSDMKKVSFSLLEGVRSLWNEEEKILASIIAIFSLILPVIKLSVLWAETLFFGLLSEKWMGFLQIISSKKKLFLLLISGFLIFTNWGVWIYAVANEKIIDASFGYFIMPIISVLLGYIFFKENLKIF